jgi:ATP-dependent protease ClpP protease subunit
LNTNYFKFTKNEAKQEATVFIYGAIGDMDYETWELINTASKFRAEFENATANADTVKVRISSPGGYVDEGLAIYNIIFGSKKKIITYNDGLCASMAAIILLSGDEIHAYRNSLLMIHNCSGMTFGNVKEIEEQLESQRKMDSSMGTAIEDRLGISAKDVEKNYLNYKDNWFESSEALELGFYDKIIQKDKDVPTDLKNMSAKKMHQKYAAFFKKKMPTNTHPKPKKMPKPNSFPNLQAALGLDQPIATTDEGSYINDEQKSLIENKITGLKSSLQALRDEKEGEMKILKDEKADLDTKLTAANFATTEGLTFLKAIAKAAGVVDLKEDATLTEINDAITAQVAVLNKKPGSSHTSGKVDPKGDQDKKHAYLDLDASIYDEYNKLKK